MRLAREASVRFWVLDPSGKCRLTRHHAKFNRRYKSCRQAGRTNAPPSDAQTPPTAPGKRQLSGSIRCHGPVDRIQIIYSGNGQASTGFTVQNKEINKSLPPLPDKAPGINKFKYQQKFGVIVLCKDEAHHKTVYEQLNSQGYKCKVVRV